MSIEAFAIAMKAGIQAINVNLFIMIFSFIIGSLIGLLVAILRFNNIPIISKILDFMTYILKGVPAIVILFLIFATNTSRINEFFKARDLPNIIFLGNQLTSLIVAIIAFGIYQAIRSSEAFKTALNAIDKSQFEAAYALGFTSFEAYKEIIFPQMIITATPILGNLAISLLKITSIVSLISIIDSISAARFSVIKSYSFAEAYLAILVIFWFFSIIIELIVNKVNHAQKSKYGIK